MSLLEAAREKAKSRPLGGHRCLACQSPYSEAIREVLTDMRERAYILTGTQIHDLLVEQFEFPQGVNSIWAHLRNHERELWSRG